MQVRLEPGMQLRPTSAATQLLNSSPNYWRRPVVVYYAGWIQLAYTAIIRVISPATRHARKASIVVFTVCQGK